MKLILNHPDHPAYWAVSANGSWQIHRTRARLRGENRYTVVRDNSRRVQEERHVIHEAWLLRFMEKLCRITGSKRITLHEWDESGTLPMILDYVADERTILAMAA